ncbi:MAG: phage integrase N-terminal SAM-like domain-containing protein [Chloroflexi bacterium]|uniref:Phage integrase N-terminal SAM-like domain-containing protein n=1 Tax=Candidatus Chlorohelix allophototropha TaxID=3003348 RepID=A0A8T7LWN4_9CHLR|nr:phage integrase N-terminal SAM-like domain-containing protein [Chloroflexota bacterium]WJW65777.1 phage integrase N-terminal SAM-like domain-containing protein [Chloroflexota bacterium L227-S17]
MQPKTTDTTKFNSAMRGISPCPFLGLINQWLDYCRANGLTDKTLLDYNDKLNKFLWWYKDKGYYREAGAHPKNMTTQMATEFVVYLREHHPDRWGIVAPHHNKTGKDLSPASIASYGRTV